MSSVLLELKISQLLISLPYLRKVLQCVYTERSDELFNKAMEGEWDKVRNYIGDRAIYVLD